MTEQTAEDIAFGELASMIKSKEEAGVEFQIFIKQLEKESSLANRRVEVARMAMDMCSATKSRKPRSDKGAKRNAKAKPSNPRAD